MRNVNIIREVLDITDASGTVAEPVTLAEQKAYMRLQGYLNVGATGDVSYTDDDTLITNMIVAARKILERRLSLSIVSHTWQADLDNNAASIQLPYGPVTSIVSVTPYNGTAYETDDIRRRGDELYQPCGCNLTVVYETTGTTNEAINLEIMRLVCYLYFNRADEEAKGFQYSVSKPFSRRSWLV